MKRVNVVETPEATEKKKPTYEELVAALKAVLDEYDGPEHEKARALVAKAEG